MAGPKITRLNDPANPYGGKRTPTAAPTPKQAAANKARSQTPAPMPKATPAPAKRTPTIIGALNNEIGGGARKRALDAAIERDTGPSKPKRRP